MLHAQPREQQRHRTAHAEDGHEHALLIPEDVARRHLLREGHVVPDGRDVFKQYFGPVGRGFGLQQRRRLFAQVLGRHDIRRQHRAYKRQRRRDEGILPIEVEFHPRERERVAIGMIHNHGEQRMSRRHAHRHAEQAGRQAIGRELFDDVAILIPKPFERTGIDAFLVHKARHRRERHERGHKIQEDREHLGELVDDLRHARIDAVPLRPRKLAPRVHRIGRLRERRKLCAGIGQLPLGFGDLRLYLRALFLKFHERGLVFRVLAGQPRLRPGDLPAGCCQLRPAVLHLRLCVGELFFRRRKLCLAVVQLLLGRGKLRLGRRQFLLRRLELLLYLFVEQALPFLHRCHAGLIGVVQKGLLLALLELFLRLFARQLPRQLRPFRKAGAGIGKLRFNRVDLRL